MYNCNKNSYSFKFTTVSTVALTALTALSGLLLSTPHASADSSAGVTVSVTVPAVCSLTANSDSVSNTIYPGNDGLIGTTNIKAICNDPSGLAVYAVGYTNDTYGNNKLVNNVGGNNLEIRSYATSSGTPPQSEWNMTLTAVNGDYIPTIATGFDSAHAIPSAYTKVAYRNTMTDMGSNATGANFTAAFNAYIANDQAAGTYTGKVKFTLVHPVAADEPVDDNQIAVIYDGDGLTFTGGASTNRVVYGESCEDQYGYIADTPTIIKTANLNADGTQNGSYNENVDEWIDLGTTPFEDASKIKLEITYAISEYTSVSIYDSDWNNYVGYRDGKLDCVINDVDGCSGTTTIIVNGDSVKIQVNDVYSVNPEYDYGVYIRAYPIYEDEHTGATYGVIQNVCSFVAVGGEYAETTTWNGHWEIEVGGYSTWFYDESEVVEYLNQNAEELKGGSIRIMAYYPYRIVYNGNQATAGTMQDYYTTISSVEDYGNLLSPNFLKTGYGFAGWSENPSAAVNGNDKIYSPTEEVYHSDLTFDANRVATLYAVWVPSAGNLQSWSGCSSMSTGSVTALTDTRDGNTYAIGKYGDGKCWMMENLRLDLADANTTINITNTNNPDSDFLEARQSVIGSATARPSIGSCSSRSCIEQIMFYNGYVDTSLSATPYPFASPFTSWLAYGVLYNWYTATAGNGKASMADNEVAAGDLCPYGWHIPTSASGGEIYNLMSLFGTVETSNNIYYVQTKEHFTFPYNHIGSASRGGDPQDIICYLIDGESSNICKGGLHVSTNFYGDSAGTLEIFEDAARTVRNRVSGYSSSGGVIDKSPEEAPVRCLAN